MQQRFVHLRVHTEYSLVDGLIRIKPLVNHLSERGMSAVAVTDHCNLFAVVKVFQASVAAGIKPLIGCDLVWHDPDKPEQVFSLVLLCQNEEGYRNLTCLVSKAYQEGQHHGQPRVQKPWIEAYSQGLIALSGGRLGDVGQALLAGDETSATQLAQYWAELFPGRFYIEVQRTGRVDEVAYNESAVRLAQASHLPLVATNDVRFLNESDYEAHEARVCIHQGNTLSDPRRPMHYSAQQYLRSVEEMIALFHDLPQAVQNTVEISKRCSVKLNLGQNYLPHFPVPEHVSVEQYLSQLAEQGLLQRLAQIFKDDAQARQDRQEEYTRRLIRELEVINSMGFAGYFLIVADFIKWAKSNDVPVGPGRGSGAGSLVAYALDITDLDPLQYDLLFERFLNPERVSMPDFDIDFCMEGRDRVIEYVAQKYGRQSVSQIITFGSMAAKAVIRDVGRVLGHPYGFVDKLAKLVPFELGMTLNKALAQEDELRRRYENEEEVKELFDLALALEGVSRNAGKHAGGVVIAPSQLTDFTAVYCEEGSTQLISQFDKDDVEAAGLVKFDFLGLRTLTIIKWALESVNAQRSKNQLPAIDIVHIPMDDDASFELLKSCQTTAVFQLESRGMKELIRRLQPDCFEDIIALVALFRPGPLQSGMVDDFIDRKHGRAQVVYPHPDLEPILRPTYGVILYQEQVMQIAQVLASYTLGAADLLRRAMGKKKPEEMAQQRTLFTEGAVARGVEASTATLIFDLMEKFAGYGFNKSHSAAYALVAYQTAWLKAHHPAAFMAAVLSADMDNTDKVVVLIQECRQMNLILLPPSIEHAQYAFTAVDNQTIMYGLGAIKGVGESAIEHLVEEREQRGPYANLFELCERLDLRRVNRRVLEALVKSGAMDCWGVERAVLYTNVDNAMRIGQQSHQNQANGQTDLFGLLDESSESFEYTACENWDERERLQAERDTLGFYLSGHPADAYVKELAKFITPMLQLRMSSTKKATTLGLVTQLKRVITKRGKKLFILHIEDAVNTMDVVVFSEVFDALEQQELTGQVVVVHGEVSPDEFSGGFKMVAEAVYRMEEARSRFARYLKVPFCVDDEAKIPALQSLLKTHPGQCIVRVSYSNPQAAAMTQLGAQWQVNPSDTLLREFQVLFEGRQAELCY